MTFEGKLHPIANLRCDPDTLSGPHSSLLKYPQGQERFGWSSRSCDEERPGQRRFPFKATFLVSAAQCASARWSQAHQRA
jgi:hypothetical protein